jgi:sodium/bile acid cotransporter 7
LLPSTVQSSIAFTAIAGGNVPAALCSASVSNLLGIAMTPLLVTLFFKSHGSGFNGNGVWEIAVQLLLPFALGQALRPAIGGWILRNSALTSYVDRGSILLIVYAAFSEGMVAGIWGQLTPASFALVLATDFLILVLILATTAFLSRRLGFSREDEIAIVFCGSKKSMAAGIPMANILFPGQGTAMILLPVMLFHQIQLFVCAALARRYARERDHAVTQID